MPQLKTYDLFVSHTWRHDDDYFKFKTMLEEAPNFHFRNYSVPHHDPIINPDTPLGKNKLTKILTNQVKPVNCVVILSGIYVTHSDWILKEIEIAKSYNKPIIGVSPWGQQHLPKAVKEEALEIVG